MVVRRTKTFSSASGPGYTFRPGQSVGSGSRVRQVTLLNLGVEFDQGQRPLPWPNRTWSSAPRDTAELLREPRLAKATSMDSATATVDPVAHGGRAAHQEP